MTAKIAFVNPPPGESVDWGEVLPWLEQEYPDGWVIVSGRQAHTAHAIAMLGFTNGEVLEPMFSPAVTVNGNDRCRYCRHLRRDHDVPVNIGCGHAMCVCFHYEENTNA